MHRLPASLAAVPSDRGAGILIARRRLDGGFFFQHQPDTVMPGPSCLSFVHRDVAGGYPHAWQRRPGDCAVDLVIDGGKRALAHSIVFGRTIAAADHPAAPAALILAVGIVRLSRALELPLLIDRGLADLVAWLIPPVEDGGGAADQDDPPVGTWCGRFRPAEQANAMSLAFARARERQEVRP